MLECNAYTTDHTKSRRGTFGTVGHLLCLTQRYGKETLCHFTILDNSNLIGERQTCLLDAIALAHASTTKQHANRDLASRNHGRQIYKKKDDSPAYPYKTYPKKKDTGAAPSAKSN